MTNFLCLIPSDSGEKAFNMSKFGRVHFGFSIEEDVMRLDQRNGAAQPKIDGCANGSRAVGIANGYLIASAPSIALAGDVGMLKSRRNN